MHPDDKGFDQNGYSYSWNWKPGEQQHPYTYSWADIIRKEVEEQDQRIQELEWEIAYLNIIDALVDQMTSYPEIEELLKKF